VEPRFGDLNNDGWEDVVITCLGGHPQVLLNRGGKAHWLVISLRGTRSNRDGYGARVQVNGQTRYATSASVISLPATSAFISDLEQRTKLRWK